MATEDRNTNNKWNPKRIAALVGVVMLVALYIGTFVAALVDSTESEAYFRMCLYGTVCVPILLWLFTWIMGKLTNKND